MNKWAYRLSQSSRKQREAKTELLPLLKPIRDALSLEYHLQLEALHAGVGSLMALQVVMRAVIATGILCELGYGDIQRRTKTWKKSRIIRFPPVRKGVSISMATHSVSSPKC
ncbi:hypothetical protein PQR11_19550 [Paraburkholderia strydomiana]